MEARRTTGLSQERSLVPHGKTYLHEAPGAATSQVIPAICQSAAIYQLVATPVMENWRRTARMPQYNIVIRHSIGALATLSAFLMRNRRRLIVMSASKPTKKVLAAKESPMMVRYWRCHPYASFLILTHGQLTSCQLARLLVHIHAVWMRHQVPEGISE